MITLRLPCRLLVCLVVAALAPLGCAHRVSNNFAQELAQVHYPPWVLRGSGPAKVGEQRSFFGVGQVSGMRNVALARSTADNRARAELAKSFEVFAASVLAAWVTEQESGEFGKAAPPAAAGAGAGAGAADPDAVGNGNDVAVTPAGVTLLARPAEMSSEQLIKTLTAAALVGVQVVEHWFHPDDGAVFSLARLDLSQVGENVLRVRELRPNLRAWLQAHLQLQHDAMCEQKLRQDAALTGALETP